MGRRRPDVTSHREHDDSVFRIFTCFCGKGWESSSKKKSQVRFWGLYKKQKNLQEVLVIVLKKRKFNVPAVGRLHTSESETCIVTWVVCSKHFKPEYFALWILTKRKGFW